MNNNQQLDLHHTIHKIHLDKQGFLKIGHRNGVLYVIGLCFYAVSRSIKTLLCAHFVALLTWFTHLLPGPSLFDYSSFFILGIAVMMFRTGVINMRQLLLVIAVASVSAYFQSGSEIATAMGFAAALAIAFASLNGHLGQFFGKISYSLYLVHIPVGTTVEGAIAEVINPGSLALSLLGLGITLAITIASAYAFYMLIERHFIHLAEGLFLGGARSKAVSWS